MMRTGILVVARDAEARAKLAQWLLNAGYAVELAESPRRAEEVMGSADMALAIVAPDGFGAPGLDLIRELAGRIEHVIVITGEAQLGGDDAALQSIARISMPLREPEVLARVSSALAPRAAGQPELLSFDRYVVDVGRRTCMDADGRDVSLTYAEFCLLTALARHPGRVVSRDELSRAALDRDAEPHDRSVDVLISRLRRKIEPDPKLPRIILTVPGKGYGLAGASQAAGAGAATVGPSAQVAMSAPPSPSRRPIGSLALAAIGAGATAVALVGLMAAFWLPGAGTRTPGPALPAQKFDAAVVPLVWDYVRTELSKYEREPRAKAIAISREGWGVSSGAASEEAAKSEALQRCRDRDTTGFCRIYALGDEVVWSTSSLALPLPADVRSDGMGSLPVTAESLNKLWQMIWHVSPPQHVMGYLSGKEHKALAIDFSSTEWWSGRPNRSEAIRIAVERCSDRGREPCLLLLVDGSWSVALPQSHRITRPFTLAGESEMSDPERQRIAQIYSGKDWRALARGKSGRWYAVDEAQTEDAAAELVMRMCHAAEPECLLHAIGNWRVEQKPGAGNG